MSTLMLVASDCPFCGGTYARIFDNDTHYIAACEKCDARAPRATTSAGAAANWNARLRPVPCPFPVDEHGCYVEPQR